MKIEISKNNLEKVLLACAFLENNPKASSFILNPANLDESPQMIWRKIHNLLKLQLVEWDKNHPDDKEEQ